MLARRRVLDHPRIGQVDLPLLVPAFSSKGFQLLKSKELGGDYSELAYELDQVPIYHPKTLLLSAYDLHFSHFRAPEFPERDPVSHVNAISLLFLDSGGYELNPDFETSQIKQFAYTPKDGFGRDQYEEILNSCHERTDAPPIVAASFDHASKGLPFLDQVHEARRLFRQNTQFASAFILKPEEGREVVRPRNISSDDYEELRTFHIVGVAEKELGKKLFDRLRKLVELRSRLDSVRPGIPIHVWGGLDPILTPLYFFAGADIFDGLSWLRYGYHAGIAVSREASGVLEEHIGVEANYNYLQHVVSLNNCHFLERLSTSLAQWVDFEGRQFDMFEPGVRDHLERAYAAMETRIPQLRRP